MTRPPAPKELLAALLGPTGYLRAPAMVCGDTLIVGFSDEAANAAGLG